MEIAYLERSKPILLFFYLHMSQKYQKESDKRHLDVRQILEKKENKIFAASPTLVLTSGS